MAPTPRPTVLSKVAAIFEALAPLGVAGVSQLSRETGLAKGTVFRLATELVELGLLERAGDGYRLGPKLFELGSLVPGRRQFRDAALPFLEDLSQATDQTVHLAVLDGSDVMYVERLVGERSAEVPSAVARRLPLNCTATGKCLLAFGPTALTEQVLDRPLVALTAGSIVDTERLTEELDRVRATGLATEIGEVVEGVSSVAAPVWEVGDRLAGAISATGPIDDFETDRVAALVRLAASGLSHRLGARR
ncbi:MAG: IclR family transcriptional regulator [Actinomycetota bacterium]